MRYGNVVILALGALLGEISSKGWIPLEDILRGIENGVTQVSGTSYFHVGVAVGKLP